MLRSVGIAPLVERVLGFAHHRLEGVHRGDEPDHLAVGAHERELLALGPEAVDGVAPYRQTSLVRSTPR